MLNKAVRDEVTKFKVSIHLLKWGWHFNRPARTYVIGPVTVYLPLTLED